MSHKLKSRRRILSLKKRLLHFNRAFTEYITLNQTYSLTGVFEMEFTFLYDSVDQTYLSLVQGSAQQRVLINETGFIFQFDGSNISLSDPILFNQEHNLIIKRDAVNDIYYSLNGGADVLITNTTTVLQIKTIGAQSLGVRRFLNGWLRLFRLNTSTWLLNEGSGTVLTSSDSLIATYNTTGDANHVNNNSWQLI